MTGPTAPIPKVELHCHLLGVISPALLARIRRDGGPTLVDPAVLAAAYPVQGVDAFRRWVQILKPYQTAGIAAMRPVLAAHVEALVAQHVVYTEIMVTPTLFPAEPRARLVAFQRWREWALEMERGRIQVEFLLVLPRDLADDLVARDTATFVELYREGLIAGVALVGLETGQSLARFAAAFARWREAGLGIEIHAGEHHGADSVRDALTHGRPQRLGHGLAVFRDESLVDRVRRDDIHLEFCPTSNLRTGAVPSLAEHPIARARALGLGFSVNTDDPGAFECSLDGEHRLLSEAFAFDERDFRTVYENSLRARFQPRLRYLDAPAGGAASPS